MKNQHPISIIWAFVLVSLLAVNITDQELPIKGVVIDSIVCLSVKEQSYVLYLPNGTIKTTGGEVGEIEIVDAFGRLLKNASISDQDLNIADLPNGIYFILFHLEDQIIAKRIIKE